MPIHVTIISNDSDARDALAATLNSSGGFHCVGQLSWRDSVCDHLAAAATDLIVVDLDFSARDCLQSIQRVKFLVAPVPLVYMAPFEDTDKLVDILNAGAAAYFMRNESGPSILKLLEQVCQGASPISGLVARRLISLMQERAPRPQSLSHLSSREKEILGFLARGYPYKQIAGHLNISINTVRTYIRRLYAKLEVPCRTHAVLKYQPLPAVMELTPTENAHERISTLDIACSG